MPHPTSIWGDVGEDSDDSKTAPEPDQKADDREQRLHPRMPLETAGAIFKLDEGFTVLGNCDISLGGLSFLTDRKFDTGRTMHLNILDLIGLEIEVMHVEMEMIESHFMEARYRVGCRFVDGPLDEELYQTMLRSMENE